MAVPLTWRSFDRLDELTNEEVGWICNTKKKKKNPMQFDSLAITGEKITEQINQCHEKDTRSTTIHHILFCTQFAYCLHVYTFLTGLLINKDVV